MPSVVKTFFGVSIMAALLSAAHTQNAVQVPESRFWFGDSGCKGKGPWALPDNAPSKPECSPPNCKDDKSINTCDYRLETEARTVCVENYVNVGGGKLGPLIGGICQLGFKKETRNMSRYVCKLNCSPSPSPSPSPTTTPTPSASPTPSATPSVSPSPSPSASTSPSASPSGSMDASVSPTPSGMGQMRYLETKKAFEGRRYPLAVHLALEKEQGKKRYHRG